MSQPNCFNPEGIAQTIMNKSFLRPRDDKRDFSGSQFFRENRIRSCSYVKECKGGLKAVPYYDKRAGMTEPRDQTMRKSWTASVHSNRKVQHAGGYHQKTLSVYNPGAQRNLMSVPDYVPPYPNNSHIQIGKRSQPDPKHYLTTYRNDMIYSKRQIQTNHPGIQAYKNKWIRSRLQK